MLSIDFYYICVYNGIVFHYGHKGVNMYSNRDLDKPFKDALKNAKVILVTGTRQVGKSTSLLNGFNDFAYINLYDDSESLLAKSDPKLFFKDRKFPLILDNINNSISLLDEIKILIDKNKNNGQFILIGERSNYLIDKCKNCFKDDLIIIDMSSLSLREKYEINFNNPFIPSDRYLKLRNNKFKEYKDIWDDIHRGSYPFLLDLNNDWQNFYRDFLKTYIERDLRMIVNVKDEFKFRQFLISLAARSSCTIVYKDIADEVSVDIKTVQKWIDVVADSGLIKIINTYRNKYTKRAVKSPKIYFMDTGLVCYLGGWHTPLQAKNGAMAKCLFETLVVSEIIKSYMNQNVCIEDRIFYYREKGNKVIDLVIVDDKNIYPIAIRNAYSIDEYKSFKYIKCPKDYSIKDGIILCRCDELTNIKGNIKAIPIEYI